MFNPILKQNYPFLTNYFETMFSNDVLKIPNSIVFYGLDALAQYYFSLNIAKIHKICRDFVKIDNKMNFFAPQYAKCVLIF